VPVEPALRDLTFNTYDQARTFLFDYIEILYNASATGPALGSSHPPTTL